MNNSVASFDEFKKKRNNENDSSGSGGDMEARIAKLESDVKYIQKDISEIKLDIREIKADIKKDNTTTNTRLSNLEKSVSNIKYWIIGASATMSVVITLIQLGILNIAK